MADNMDEPALPPTAVQLSINLPHKPTASLSCTFTAGNTTQLVVFLNGLGLPQSHWWAIISAYLSPDLKGISKDHPAFLTYDRYGQGLTTSPDPQDDDPSLPPGHRHDLVSVVHDLHIFLKFVAEKFHKRPLSSMSIIFVANSIGCAIARYYAQTYPATISAMLLLDSYMTDTTFVDLYPDPEAPDYDESKLPDGITTADIIAAREGMGKLFRPDVVNKEGFWRGTITSLLPHPNTPKLSSPRIDDGEDGPFVTVVGHDWDVFAEESLRMKGMTKAVAMNYTNPAWGRYNQGLLEITNEGKAKGMIADGAGHFIQKDRPDIVAAELRMLVEKVYERDRGGGHALEKII